MMRTAYKRRVYATWTMFCAALTALLTYFDLVGRL